MPGAAGSVAGRRRLHAAASAKANAEGNAKGSAKGSADIPVRLGVSSAEILIRLGGGQVRNPGADKNVRAPAERVFWSFEFMAWEGWVGLIWFDSP